jgi:predicted nucleotidyltransferase
VNQFSEVIPKSNQKLINELYEEVKPCLSAQLKKEIESLPPSQQERIKLIAARAELEPFYRTLFETTLEFLSDILTVCERKGYEVCVAAIRGSLARGTVDPTEDSDITVIVKHRSKFLKSIRELYNKYNEILKLRCSQLTRESPLCMYAIKKPKNPKLQTELFVNDPCDLERRNEPYIENYSKKNMKILNKYLSMVEQIVNTALKKPDTDTIRLSEYVRDELRELWKIPYSDGHNATLIIDARLSGMVFAHTSVPRTNIVKVRDKLLYECFGHRKEMQKILFYFEYKAVKNKIS